MDKINSCYYQEEHHNNYKLGTSSLAWYAVALCYSLHIVCMQSYCYISYTAKGKTNSSYSQEEHHNNNRLGTNSLVWYATLLYCSLHIVCMQNYLCNLDIIMDKTNTLCSQGKHCNNFMPDKCSQEVNGLMVVIENRYKYCIYSHLQNSLSRC